MHNNNNNKTDKTIGYKVTSLQKPLLQYIFDGCRQGHSRDFKIQCTLGTLQKNFSGQHFEICFLIFSRKHVLTFHANCLHWRQFA